MASFRKRGRNWYFRYSDADGVKQEVKGCPDRRETERMAAVADLEASRIRGKLIDPKDTGYRDHAARPLGEHLAEWRDDMLAKGKTTKHAAQYHERAGKLIGIIKGISLKELQPGRKAAALERAAKKLASVLEGAFFTDIKAERIQSGLATLRDQGISLQTCNHFRAAIRAFLRWASDRGRIRESPMRGVGAFNAAEDLRHARRSLTDVELGQLVRAAAAGPIRFDMDGQLRAMAYRVAAATGFRADELRSLTPEAFRLDRQEPSILLRASSAKDRRPADQPIPLMLARDLCEWLRGKPSGQSVFPLNHETAKAIRGDLEAAGIPYETEDGAADFHALRSYFISALIRSGASISEVHKLARHAKPETTLKHYAKVSAHDLRGAVEAMPTTTGSYDRPEMAALAATGTEDSTHKQQFAHQLPTDRRGLMHSDAVTCGMTGSSWQGASDTETPGNEARSGSVRAFAARTTERGGFEPPKPVSQFNGLANRRYRPLSHLSCSGKSSAWIPR
jgi:integrase